MIRLNLILEMRMDAALRWDSAREGIEFAPAEVPSLRDEFGRDPLAHESLRNALS